MIAGITAVAALLGALGGLVAGVASVISAVNAWRGRKAAIETKELVQNVIAVQATQHQEVHTHVHVTAATTAGADPPVAKELTFPPAPTSLPEARAAADLSPLRLSSGQDKKA